MDEIGFRKWMVKQGINKKVQSDAISRAKRIEREINHCDIDEQYHSDKCARLLEMLSRKMEPEDTGKIQNTNLPIGQYSISTYKYAIRLYVRFRDANG